MGEPESDRDPGPGASRELERLLADVLGNMPGTAITVFDRRLRILLLTGSAPKDLDIDPAAVTGRSRSCCRPPTTCAWSRSTERPLPGNRA